ncbi:MAG: VOC family protein [Candidatus Omnitrophica bacterium]|nr:VOC family protein [Candidatus Omnitrophota bacterium]
MKAIRHSGIVVSDLERSLSFYRDIIGLKVVKKQEESSEFIDKICGIKGSKLTTVKMAADDGNLVELLFFHSHRAPRQCRNLYDIGPSHLAFTVQDIEGEYKRLLGKKVEFISPPAASPNGYVKVAFCKDPDGVFIELVEMMEGR